MSREKQIEEMAKVIEEASCGYGVDGCHRCEFDGTEDFSCAEMRIAKALYNAGYRKQEWISVDERLPDKEGTYLTYTDKDRMLFDSFCIYPSIGTKFWVGGNGKVTHWMPLPEVPKIVVLLVSNSTTSTLSFVVLVMLKHCLRVMRLKKHGLEVNERNIAVLESMEYQSV